MNGVCKTLILRVVFIEFTQNFIFHKQIYTIIFKHALFIKKRKIFFMNYILFFTIIKLII